MSINGTSRTASKYQKLGETGSRSSLTTPGETSPVDTFISDFWPLELGENEFLLSQPLSVWYSVTPVPATHTLG